MTVVTRVRLTLPALALGWLAAPSSAQSVLYVFSVHSPDSYFASAVSGAGDGNADGYADVIVGYPYSSANGKFSGSALVFSGKDGAHLHTFEGDSQGDFFGYSVGGAGDINGDGFDDIFCGTNSGLYGTTDYGVYVFSGKDGSVLHALAPNFGIKASAAGDVNADGVPDLIVGDYTDGAWSGTALVFSGLDGSILHTFHGKKAGDFLGEAVGGAGDVNGDGFADVIIGSPRTDKNGSNSGSARVFSGKNGKLLHVFHGGSKRDRFGTAVGGAGDVNGDGSADLIVGVPYDMNSKGSAWVFSGADGSILYGEHGNTGAEYLGISVSGAGDVDRDGFDDVIIGSSGAGHAQVLSGKDWSVIHTLVGAKIGDGFGITVAAAGYVNADGFNDLIVGAPYSDQNGENSGSAWVFSGCDACAIGTNYCGPANRNSTGQAAVIAATGSEAAQANNLTLTAAQLPMQRFGYFLNSPTQGFVPFAGGSQGNLCLGSGLGRHVDQIQNSRDAGEFSIKVDLTMLPTPGGPHSVVAGETWNFQAWFRDENPGSTSNFTDGIEIVFN